MSTSTRRHAVRRSALHDAWRRRMQELKQQAFVFFVQSQQVSSLTWRNGGLKQVVKEYDCVEVRHTSIIASHGIEGWECWFCMNEKLEIDEILEMFRTGSVFVRVRMKLNDSYQAALVQAPRDFHDLHFMIWIICGAMQDAKPNENVLKFSSWFASLPYFIWTLDNDASHV